jgi:hypothetical protein
MTERIGVRVPELGISGEVQFSVGVDIRITDVKLPEKIQAGVFNRVEIFVADAFGAENDLPAMLESLSVQVEAAMTLTPDAAGGGNVFEDDPVARAFLSGGRAASYPSDALVPGKLLRTDDGKFIWNGADGRIAGIVPPSPGKYHIEAVLKPNTGGPPLRHWSSPAFTVSENAVRSGADMPGLMAPALKIIAALDDEAGGEALTASRELVAKGDVKGAAASLGRYMRRASSGAPEDVLGRFSAALGASGRSADEIVNFLEPFVKGYEYGVLIFTRPGVSAWALTRSTDAGRASAGDGVFEGTSIAAVPFAVGHDITLRLEGADTEDVSLWKLVPQGVNTKKYPCGKWIKEIAVNTAGVAAQNAAAP